MDDTDSLEVTVNVTVTAPKGSYMLKVPLGTHYHRGDAVDITHAIYTYKVTLEPISCYIGNDTEPNKILMPDADITRFPVKVKHIEELGETLKVDEHNW